jgi:dienelactone hydrolase
MEHLESKLGNAPALLVFKDHPARAGHRGTVLFYHGLYASKEQQLKELEGIASRGYLAVGIDNFYHGQRSHPELKYLFCLENPMMDKNFTWAVRETAMEIPEILHVLIESGLSAPDRIGVSGISMGGFIAFSAPLYSPGLKLCAPILGSPRWTAKHIESPHLHPEAFYNTHILVQNGGEDKNVPPHEARDFCMKLQECYSHESGRIKYIEYPGAGHFMGEHTWNNLWNNFLSWLDMHLGSFQYGF